MTTIRELDRAADMAAMVEAHHRWLERRERRHRRLRWFKLWWQVVSDPDSRMG